MIIDSHHHVWDPEATRHDWLAGYPAIRRPFSATDYARVSEPCGVTSGILVQVLASRDETAEFLRLADGSGGRIAGVVGWTDLTSADVADEIARLRELSGGHLLVGIRHLVQDEPDPDWLMRPDVRRGLQAVGAAGLTYDLLVREHQLPAAIAVVGDLEQVRFVLDHGGKPEIAAARTEPWSALIADLARHPNVACKFSGLVTEASREWTAGQIAPYGDWLLRCFGGDRLMFGSDWPVCTLAASYAQVIALARELLARQLSSAEMDEVFGGNARRFYGLM